MECAIIELAREHSASLEDLDQFFLLWKCFRPILHYLIEMVHRKSEAFIRRHTVFGTRAFSSSVGETFLLTPRPHVNSLSEL